MSDEPPPAIGGAGPSGASPWTAPTDGPAAPPETPRGRSFGTSAPEDRPPPGVASLAGAAAGLLLLASLTLFLSELGGDSRRIGGIVLSLLFEALGVGLLLINRSQRSATAGVALTAIGIIPLLVYLFVDVKNPDRTLDSVSSFTSTATAILVLAALLWLAAYAFGPSRRYGFYLGAALLALWLVSVVQIIDTPLSQAFDPFSPFGRTSFDTGSSSGGSSTFDTFDTIPPGDPTFDPTTQFPDEDFDPSTDGFTSPENPSTKLGIASLIFGGAYLALAVRRDRAGDRRQATVFFAVSIPILTVAVLFLADPLNTTGASLLGIALGGAALWFAVRTGRRFTSWYAMAAIVVAVFALVGNALLESARATGVVLGLVGLVVALLAGRLEGGSPSDHAAGATPGAGGAELAAAGGAPGWAPTAPGSSSPWQQGPASPPTWTPPPSASPPDAPPTGTGPAFVAPPSGPWNPSPTGTPWEPVTPPAAPPTDEPPADQPPTDPTDRADPGRPPA